MNYGGLGTCLPAPVPAREWTPERPNHLGGDSAAQQIVRGPADSSRSSSWHSPTSTASIKEEPVAPAPYYQTVEMQPSLPVHLKPEYYFSTGAQVPVKDEQPQDPSAYLDFTAASALAAYQTAAGPSGSGLIRVRSLPRSPRPSRSRSRSSSPRGQKSRKKHRRRSRSRQRSRSRGRSKRSRSRSRSRHRHRRRSHKSQSRSRSRSHGRRRERSRSKDRRRRGRTNMTQEMLKIRREVELMYDNAMQAMIRKKEEEFAQLQALVMPPLSSGYRTSPVSPPQNPLEGSTNYAPALPVQGLGASWGSDPRSNPPGFGLANRLRYEHSTYAIPPPAGQVAPVGAYSTLPAHPADAEYNFLMDVKNRFFPVVDIKVLPDHLANLVTNIEGSRFVQDNLDRATAQDKELLFKKILPKLTWLAMNVFGNYVIQKYFECGTAQQVMQMFHKILPETRKLVMNKYGSRVVQTALSYITQDQHTAWTKELTKDVIAFCKDANGNHVVQKCMETAENPNSPHMVDMLNRIQEVAYNLCTDRFGCRVLQKMIQVYTAEQTAHLKNCAHELTQQLMTSNFGNYLVQDLMEYGTPEDRNRVFAACVGQVMHMSHDKFASNIIENVLKKGSLQEKTAIVREVCNVNSLVIMMKDQYANYVVQRMIETADVTMLRELHIIMLQFIHNVTPSINEKMRKNLDINCQNPATMRLARLFFDNQDKYNDLCEKYVDNVPKIETWLRQIKENTAVTIEEADVSLLVLVVRDINGSSSDDLDFLFHDLRGYLKCLVQDYCKKNANFIVRPGKMEMGLPPPGRPVAAAAAIQYPVGGEYGTAVQHSGTAGISSHSSIYVHMQDLKPPVATEPESPILALN